MKIVRLDISNYKKIRAARITPKGDIVRVEGRNSAGKSTVLDAIESALCGGRQAVKPVTIGEDKATIRVDLGDYTVTRTINEEGRSTLKMERKDGQAIKSPQAFLDSLIGSVFADVSRFLTANEKDQIKMVADATGLGLSDIDHAIEAAEQDRLVAGREADRSAAAAEKELQLLGAAPDGPTMEEALANQSRIRSQVESQAELRRKLDSERAKYAAKKSRVEQLDADIAALLERVRLMQSEQESIKKEMQDMLPACQNLAKEVAELPEIQGQNEAEEMVRLAMRASAWHESKKRCDMLQVAAGKAAKAWREHQDRVVELRNKRRNAVMQSLKQIDGLDIDDNNEMMLHGVPIKQASTSQRLLCAARISMLASPDVRVMLVRDGSVLDSESMRDLAEFAKQHDMQVWVERVSEENMHDGAIYIEDGEVL